MFSVPPYTFLRTVCRFDIWPIIVRLLSDSMEQINSAEFNIAPATQQTPLITLLLS